MNLSVTEMDVLVIIGGMAVMCLWAMIGHYLDTRKARKIQRSINASVSQAKRTLKQY